MKIGEIETRAGMTRANIRFYESEGLLEPRRLENGYRDYSEEDLNTLLRIRLLRGLRMPLDEIRALQTGQTALDDALTRQLELLGGEQAELTRAQELCRVLCDEGVRYDSLDAPTYLARLEGAPAVPAGDVAVAQRVPWRRYWARSFDMVLYGMIALSVAALVFHAIHRASGITLLHRIVLWAVQLVLLVLLEPFFLSRFGTTPGKWIMGLGVTDPDGGRLTFDNALTRTVVVLCCGLGFGLPLVGLYTEIRSHVLCERGEPLAWEDNSVITVRDRKIWRYIVLAVCGAAAIALTVLAILCSWRMPNRGDLTVAELSQNYNRAAMLNEADIGFRLGPDGTWQRIGNTIAYVGAEGTELVPPPLHIETEDGFVTGVSFEGETSGLMDLRDIESCLFDAFVGAQRGAGLLFYDRNLTVTIPLQMLNSEICAEVCGIHVERRVSTAEHPSSRIVYSTDTGTTATEEITETRTILSFSMQKTG